MARRLAFRKSHKDTLRGNDRAIRGLALMSGRDAPAELLNNVPDAKPRAAPRKLEAPVISAISDLLSYHPKVLWAGRFNSGAAGEHGHIWFHKFVRMEKPMRMPDFFGIALLQHSVMPMEGYVPNSFHPIAIEAKAPGWTKPRDQREREQEAFLSMVRYVGGVGIFATSASDVLDAIPMSY